MREQKSASDKKMTEFIIDLLINIPLFDAITADELRLMVPYMNYVEAKAGEVIFSEGDRGDYICFVAEGRLEVLKNNEHGEKVVISTLSKGRSIGEMAVVDDYPRSATVRARTSSVLVTLPRGGFETVLSKHPAIGVKLLKGLARLLSLNMRKTSSRLADYMLPIT